MKTVIIALALGDIYDDRGLGVLKEPLDGSIMRFEAGTNGVSCDGNALIVASAGYAKEKPFWPNFWRMESLAGQLGRYLDERGSKWARRSVTRPICWSTRNEVRVGMKLALNSGFARKDESVTVRIASNKSHLYRIKLYAALYAPKAWRVQFIPATHSFSILDHALEIPKFARDIFYARKLRKRLRRFQKHITTPH